MADETLVEVQGVSKRYCRRLRQSLWYGVLDVAAEITDRRRPVDALRRDEFWALRNVSVSVRRGEMLALIGPNGAGKSTLLKMLNGLVKPDAGRITIRGRLQALIELGAGFSPLLTGRENVYINGAVLGVTKAQIDRLMPAILEFAGLEEFIDTPVQSYSSGMRARLGFAVAAQLDPDVLLVDEVLAVGDMAFQEKCMRRMDELRNSDKAIVFVTHSLYQVEALCNRALWLDHGGVVQYGEAREIVRAYLDQQERRSMAEARAEGVAYQGRAMAATRAYLEMEDANARRTGGVSTDGQPLEIHQVDLLDEDGRARTEFPFQSDLTVRIRYHAVQCIYRPLFNLRFYHGDNDILETSMLIDGPGPESIEGAGIVECRIPHLPLTPKVYEIVLFVRSGDGIADVTTMRTVTRFRVTDTVTAIPCEGPMALTHLRQGSPVYVSHDWRFIVSGSESSDID